MGQFNSNIFSAYLILYGYYNFRNATKKNDNKVRFMVENVILFWVKMSRSTESV